MTRSSTRRLGATGCAVAAVGCFWATLSGDVDLEWLRFSLANAGLVAAMSTGLLLLGVQRETPAV